MIRTTRKLGRRQGEGGPAVSKAMYLDVVTATEPLMHVEGTLNIPTGLAHPAAPPAVSRLGRSVHGSLHLREVDQSLRFTIWRQQAPR